MQIDDIVHYVRLELPAVVDVLIVQTLAAVAMDFCERTRLWDEIQDPTALLDGTSQYDVDVPRGARLLGVSDVWAAGYPLTPITMDALGRVLPAWQSAQSSQPVYYNAARDRAALSVFPTPLGALRAPLTVRAQFAPLRNATALPDFLAERHLDALVAGAKARLMTQINLPWSSPQTGLYHQQAYDSAVISARIQQIHDRTAGPLRVASRRFG